MPHEPYLGHQATMVVILWNPSRTSHSAPLQIRSHILDMGGGLQREGGGGEPPTWVRTNGHLQGA